MQNTTRLGHRQATILSDLASDPQGQAPSILSLEPASDFVHTWHYRSVHSLAKHGFVDLVPQAARTIVRITDAGLKALAALNA